MCYCCLNYCNINEICTMCNICVYIADSMVGMVASSLKYCQW